MNDHDEKWVLDELAKLRTDDNRVTIDAAIDLIKEQQDEIDSLHGSMEGQLWSPKQWRQ